MDSKAVYDTLRQELLDGYHRQINVVTFTFTATAAIIGFAFTAHNAMIFLLPILILWLSLVQLNNTMYSVFSISVYIRKFIESENDFPRWEQDISAFRHHLRYNKPIEQLKRFNPIISFDAYHYARAIVGMGIVCLILCFWYSFYWHYGPERLISYVETNISLISFGMGAYFWATQGRKLLRPIHFINSGEFERRLGEEWDKVKPPVPQQKVKIAQRNSILEAIISILKAFNRLK